MFVFWIAVFVNLGWCSASSEFRKPEFGTQPSILRTRLRPVWFCKVFFHLLPRGLINILIGWSFLLDPIKWSDSSWKDQTPWSFACRLAVPCYMMYALFLILWLELRSGIVWRVRLEGVSFKRVNFVFIALCGVWLLLSAIFFRRDRGNGLFLD